WVACPVVRRWWTRWHRELWAHSPAAPILATPQPVVPLPGGPWMVRSGWTKHRAATVIAGNSDLGAALPPSASMVIMIGFAGTLVTTSQVYLALLIAGMYQVIYRVFLTIWFVYRDGIKAETGAEHVPLKVTMKRGWPSTLIFFGAVIPIFMTVGPLANALKASPVAEAMDDISLIMW